MPAVELFGGALDGVIHEIEPGWPVPGALGLTMGDDKSVLYWYKVRPNLEEADYVNFERRDVDD